MRRLVLTTLAILALAFGGAGMVHATAPGDNGFHKVWVCKYVGQPGDFEALKPGKQPIVVDVASADAFVGADFADGQTHSFVIDLATDENTGQGETYIGEATCPTPEATSPPPDESATPSVEPTVEPTVEPSLPSQPSPDASTGVSPTPPNTAAEETSSASPDRSWYWLAVALFIGAFSYVLLWPRKRHG